MARHRAVRRHVPVVSADSLAWNTLFNYGSMVFVSIAGFVLTPQIVGHVGAVAFGVFSLSGILVAYAALLDFGLGLSAMKLIADQAHDPDTDSISSLVSGLFRIYALIGAAIGLLGFMLGPVLAHHLNIPDSELHDFWVCYELSVIALAVVFPQSILSAVLNGLRDYAIQNTLVIAYTATTFAGSLAVLFAGGGIVALTILSFCLTVGHFVLRIWIVRRRHGIRISLRGGNYPGLRGLSTLAGWLFVINLASKIIFETDIFVAGALLGPASVAAYQVALSLSTAMRRVAEQLNVITLTTASSLWAQDDRPRLQELFLEALRLTSLLMFPAVAIVVIFGKAFLTLWVGAGLARRSFTTLVVLAGSMAVVSVQATAGQILIALGRHRIVAIACLSEASVNFCCSIVLGARYGLVGIALGTLIPSVLFAGLITVPIAGRTLGIAARRILGAVLPFVAQAGLLIAACAVYHQGVGRTVSTLYGAVGSMALMYAIWTSANIFVPRRSRRLYGPIVSRTYRRLTGLAFQR